MNIPLHHKWALFIASRSRSRVGAYIALLAAVVFLAWAWIASGESYWGVPFGIGMFWLAASILFLERRAFAELLALKDAEIARLLDERRGPA